MIEVTLSSDSFKQNPTFADEIAILRQLYNLIVMKPGTDPLNPAKGCDVNSAYYKFKSEMDTIVLEQTIKEQILAYTDYKISNVSCKTLKSGEKWVLHVFLSIMGMERELVVSTNGEFSQYTVIDSLTQEIFDENQ